MRVDVRENVLRLEVIRKAPIGQARAAERIGLFLELGLDAPVNFFHQAGEIVVVALEGFLEKIQRYAA